jgi:predicted lipid-binding transport protein (Tim44 family)
MNPMRLLILLTVVGTTGSILFAAEPAGTAKQGQPAAPTAQPAGSMQPAATTKAEQSSKAAPRAAGEKQPAAAAPDEDVDPAPPPKTEADKGPSPQRFVPSEQVRADFDVSFPVDI